MSRKQILHKKSPKKLIFGDFPMCIKSDYFTTTIFIVVVAFSPTFSE